MRYPGFVSAAAASSIRKDIDLAVFMRTIRIISLLAIGLLGVPLLAQNDNGRPEVTPAVRHDVSLPLAQLNAPARPERPRENPLRPIPHAAGNQSDPVVQNTAGPLVSASPALSFAGVGNGDYGFVPNAAPPDTNGAVGATQYVQWVNESFAVFDKTTGAILAGFPKPGNALWSGFGGGCQTNNDGDPIVQYDKLANRWVLTQFSVSTTPYLQCVAVSTSSDATGSYNRYSFSYGNIQFPDYPKLGVWPDAYYISFNIFNNGSSFAGSKVCAYDRTAMLAGLAATQQCFQLSTSFGGLLPSDLDGPANPPPAGSPNFFLNFGTNSLNLWKFHVDWATPANSALIGPTSIPVAAFSAACNGGNCIPQSGTAQKLDSLADRLMYRLAYRNFGDHEALVVNHSVTAGSSVGVRWYELRSPNTTPTVFQQGTYAPDSNYRWMGSIAMDKSGDIALGYSVSSSTMNPAIRFTGRAPTDTLGTLQAENVSHNGSGSQSGFNLSRWGDYSALTVDPVDDCTFWYTNEYLKANGAFNWSTWINSFQITGCGAAATPDFSLSANPTALTVAQGKSGTSTITVNSVGGFTGTVDLSASVGGCPTNASCTMSPTSVPLSANGSATSTLTVNVGATTPTGSSTLTIGGTSGTLNHSTRVSLSVVAPDFTISASPTALTLASNTQGTSTITIAALNGYTGTVNLSRSGCPTNATCTLNPTSVTNGAGSSTLSVNSGTAAAGTYTLTISGTDGTLTHTTSVTLTITAPATGDFSISASPGSVVARRNSNASYSVTVTPSNGFNNSVTLSVSGIPSGATASFSPNPIAGGSGSSTLSVSTGSAATGTYTLTITGAGGGSTHQTTVSLKIH